PASSRRAARAGSRWRCGERAGARPGRPAPRAASGLEAHEPFDLVDLPHPAEASLAQLRRPDVGQERIAHSERQRWFVLVLDDQHRPELAVRDELAGAPRRAVVGVGPGHLPERLLDDAQREAAPGEFQLEAHSTVGLPGSAEHPGGAGEVEAGDLGPELLPGDRSLDHAEPVAILGALGERLVDHLGLVTADRLEEGRDRGLGRAVVDAHPRTLVGAAPERCEAAAAAARTDRRQGQGQRGWPREKQHRGRLYSARALREPDPARPRSPSSSWNSDRRWYIPLPSFLRSS